MGAHCGICGRIRPNEAFSGRGRRTGTCKKCQQKPKTERQRIRDGEFLWNVLEQKNISEKNIETLRAISLRYADRLGERAAAVIEIALVHPRKKKRYGFLCQHKPELYEKLVRLDLIEDLRLQREEFDEELLMDEDIFLDEQWENEEHHDQNNEREKKTAADGYWDDERIPF